MCPDLVDLLDLLSREAELSVYKDIRTGIRAKSAVHREGVARAGAVGPVVVAVGTSVATAAGVVVVAGLKDMFLSNSSINIYLECREN